MIEIRNAWGFSSLESGVKNSPAGIPATIGGLGKKRVVALSYLGIPDYQRFGAIRENSSRNRPAQSVLPSQGSGGDLAKGTGRSRPLGAGDDDPDNGCDPDKR